MTAWTAPATYVALATLPASQLNTHVRDNLLYLKEQLDLRAEWLAGAYTTVGCSGSAETDAYTYTLPANKFAADGRTLHVVVWGSGNANSNTKPLRLYLGAQVINLSAIGGGGTYFNGVPWRVEATIIRASASTQRVIGSRSPDGGLTTNLVEPSNSWTADLTVSNVVKVTLQGVSSNDLAAYGWRVMME